MSVCVCAWVGVMILLKSHKRRLVCLIAIKIRYLKLTASHPEMREERTTPANGCSAETEENYVCSTVCIIIIRQTSLSSIIGIVRLVVHDQSVVHEIEAV